MEGQEQEEGRGEREERERVNGEGRSGKETNAFGNNGL